MMRPSTILALVFLTTVLVLGVTALVFGGIPEFPFTNTAQLRAEIPGMHLDATEVVSCAGTIAVMFVYTRSADPNNVMWQIWINRTRTVWSGAYYDPYVGTPRVVYFGRIEPRTNQLLLDRAELFNLATHPSPCQDWHEV